VCYHGYLDFFEISGIDIFPQDKCCFLLNIIQYLILRAVQVQNHLFDPKKQNFIQLDHKVS